MNRWQKTLLGLSGGLAGFLTAVAFSRGENQRDYIGAKYPLPDMKPQDAPLQQWVQDLFALGPRMVGSEGERKAREYLIQEFRALGLQAIQEERVPVIAWSGNARVFSDGIDYPAYPLGGTRSAKLEGRLVEVGYGTPEDYKARQSQALKGAIHLVQIGGQTHRIQKYLQALAHGAKGVIVYHNASGALIEQGMGLPVMPIPAVSVGLETGLLLKEQPQVSLEISARRSPMWGYNVTGIVPGRTTKEVLVGAHYDSWNGGAYDNASGVAALLALGRHFVEHSAYRTVRFTAFTAEEISLQGSLWSCLLHPKRWLDTVAMVNFDALGVREGETCLNCPPILEPRIKALPAFEEFQQAADRDVRFLHPPLIFSDLLWYHLSGIPSVWMADLPVVEYHTDRDTPDLIDWNLLRHEVDLNRAIADFLANGR